MYRNSPQLCAKLRLLWQPESGPIPVAMVEKDRVMTFIRQQNASAILSPGCDSGGNICYKWKVEEFLIGMLVCDYFHTSVLALILVVSEMYRCKCEK